MTSVCPFREKRIVNMAIVALPPDVKIGTKKFSKKAKK